nr:PREDICTED: chemokine C-C motif receptor-like 2 [Tribolium castaneum]|eukprot:XP_015835495.1 PREDICTED: chemokine C-C motif receptor-like 2 [Tribolium castaneum]
MTKLNEIPYETFRRIYFELLVVVSLISLAANFLLIFVMVKYKKLRQDTTNKLFLHFNVFQVVLLIGTNVGHKLLFDYEFSETTKTFNRVLCIFYQLDVGLLFGMFAILCLLVCDGFIKIYHKKKYQSFGFYCNFVPFGIYLLPVCFAVIMVPQCESDEYFSLLIYFITVGVTATLALLLIIANIIHAVRKRKLTNYNSSNIGLVVPNIFFLLWCPTLTIVLLSLFVLHAPVSVTILSVLLFANPLINLLFVYFYDSDYHTCLRLTFTCKCREYNNVNLEEQAVTLNDVNDGVLITQN